MSWALGVVLALASVPHAQRVSPSGTVVLYPPGAPTLVDTAEAIGRLDRSAVLLPVGEAWPREEPPRQVVALGERAARRARDEWPTTIRAEAFTWNPDRPDVALTLIGRPAQACVLAVLKAEAPQGWLVLASPSDGAAERFAEALGAELAVGRPRELQAHVRTLDAGVGVWLRGHPDFESISWLDNVPRVAGGERFVGTDSPGLSRYGFSIPVRLEPERIAVRLADWMHEPERRKRQRRVEELPCRLD